MQDNKIFSTEFSPREKISRAKVTLYKELPFFSYLVDILKYKQDDSPSNPTAAVDRNANFYYNSNFINSLEKDTLVGVLTHEVMHLALKHPSRIGHRKMVLSGSDGGLTTLFNIAADISVNNILVLNNIKLPEKGIIPSNNSVDIFGTTIENISSKSTEEIYDELKTHINKQQKNKNNSNDKYDCNDSKENQSSNDSGEDNNSSDKNNKKSSGKSKKQSAKKSPCSGCSKDGNCPMQKNVVYVCDSIKDKSFDDHIWDGEDERNSAEENKTNIDWDKRLAEAATYSKQRGNSPLGMEREIKEINTSKLNLESFIRREVARSIPKDLTWQRPSRKYLSQGLYLPSSHGEEIKVMFSIDTSGSISSEDLSTYLSIIIAVSKSYHSVEFRILTHDTEVHDDYHIFNGNIQKIRNIKVHGGGGTDHIPLFDYIKEKEYSKTMKVLFSFTDGYSNFPSNRPVGFNTVFILSGYHCGKEHMPSWSNVIVAS